MEVNEISLKYIALCAKSISLKNVMTIILQSVNYVRSLSLNHRIQNMATYSTIETHLWLSRGAMLKRVYHLKVFGLQQL